ncbi:MAG: hypothetical protein ACKER6_01245 [Candidatus Hodgkinia cicadicola]
MDQACLVNKSKTLMLFAQSSSIIDRSNILVRGNLKIATIAMKWRHLIFDWSLATTADSVKVAALRFGLAFVTRAIALLGWGMTNTNVDADRLIWLGDSA